uniref:Uncharacterized protein n=1 Tax=Florenciella sp. virus SA2 TaxID=3240092 RepID=A0AB39JB59_9VIRU
MSSMLSTIKNIRSATSHWGDRWEPKKVPSRARGTYAKKNA